MRHRLDPVQAAFTLGTMIRWLAFNDTWLAAEWGHPSDNLGGILAVVDYLAQRAVREGKPGPNMRAVLEALIKAARHPVRLLNLFGYTGVASLVAPLEELLSRSGGGAGWMSAD